MRRFNGDRWAAGSLRWTSASHLEAELFDFFRWPGRGDRLPSPSRSSFCSMNPLTAASAAAKLFKLHPSIIPTYVSFRSWKVANMHVADRSRIAESTFTLGFLARVGNRVAPTKSLAWTENCGRLTAGGASGMAAALIFLFPGLGGRPSKLFASLMSTRRPVMEGEFLQLGPIASCRVFLLAKST